METRRYADPQGEFERRIVQYQREHKVSRNEAMREVGREDPQLADQYNRPHGRAQSEWERREDMNDLINSHMAQTGETDYKTAWRAVNRMAEEQEARREEYVRNNQTHVGFKTHAEAERFYQETTGEIPLSLGEFESIVNQVVGSGGLVEDKRRIWIEISRSNAEARERIKFEAQGRLQNMVIAEIAKQGLAGQQSEHMARIQAEILSRIPDMRLAIDTGELTPNTVGLIIPSLRLQEGEGGQRVRN